MDDMPGSQYSQPDRPVDAVPLALASRRELNEIFAPDLAQAIWDDAQCAEKRKEICTIDFDLTLAYELFTPKS